MAFERISKRVHLLANIVNQLEAVLACEYRTLLLRHGAQGEMEVVDGFLFDKCQSYCFYLFRLRTLKLRQEVWVAIA